MRPLKNTTHLMKGVNEGREKGAGRDALLGWGFVEACVEPRRKNRVTHVGDGAELHAARTGGARLRRGGEAGQELPALEGGRAVIRSERGDVEEGWGHEA